MLAIALKRQERLIQIRKLLFNRSILEMDYQCLPKKMFFVIEQSIFLKKKDGLSDNEPWSIVNDLFTPIEVSISIKI